MKPLHTQLSDVATGEALAEGWAGVQRGLAGRRRRRRRVRLAAGSLLAALAVGLGLWATRPSPLRPLAGPQGELAGRLASGLTRLSDASAIEVAPGTALEVVENSGPRLELHLARGRARLQVTPGTGRQWHLELGELAVDVVGTVFTVEREGGSAAVEVEEGVVVVRGDRLPDRLRRLTRGERLELPPPEVPPAAPATPAPPPAEVKDAAPPPPPARDGAAPTTAAARFAAADAARRAGREEEALRGLEALVAAHPRAPEAPLAAFTLARLHQGRGEAAAAARWFRRALDLGLPPALAAEARAALAGAGP